MKKNGYKKLIISMLLFGLAFIFTAQPVTAAVVEHYGGSYGSWPADGVWVAIPTLNDIDDGLADPQYEIVGNNTYPAVYHYSNGTYKFFRVRVQWPNAVVAGTTFKGTIGIYFDWDRDNTLENAVIWDTAGSPATAHGMELQVTGTEGATWATTKCEDADGVGNDKTAPPDFSLAGGDGYLRTVDGVATTDFGTTTFVDFAINCTYLAAQTDMECTGQTWNIMAGVIDKANDHNFISGDVAGGTLIQARFWSSSIPAAIDLLSFNAQREENGVGLYWTTGSEIACGAFTLLRCTLAESDCQLTDHLELPGIVIPCRDSLFGADYAALDATARYDQGYSYYLREYETTGSVFEYGPVLLAAGQDDAEWSFAPGKELDGSLINADEGDNPSDDDDADTADDDDAGNTVTEAQETDKDVDAGCGF